MKERWWSAPLEGDGGKRVIVTGRDYMDSIISGGKFPYLVRVQWKYQGDSEGFPDDEDAALMGEMTEALLAEFKRDKVAYLVGIYTGDYRRDWIFYAHNLAIFGKVFNRALAELPTVPIEIEAQNDPDWSDYLEMRSLSYIPEDEEE